MGLTSVTILRRWPKRASGGPSTRARRFRRRFFQRKGAALALASLLILTFTVLVGPLLSSYGYAQQDLASAGLPPSTEHWLGTDRLGRDQFTRMMYAGRVSLGIGLCAASIQVTIGLLIGTFSGWFGGTIDAILSRLLDIMLSVPGILVVLVVAGIVGSSIPFLIIMLGLLGWAGTARIARAVTLSLREEDFVQAGRVLGSGNWFIISRHLVPGVLPPVVVAGTIAFATTVLAEATLSFLGAGVQAPRPSWGNMLLDGQSLTVLSEMPWLWLPPGLAVAMTVFAAMTVGDAFTDAIDERIR